MSSEQLMTLKDRETQQMLSKELAAEFKHLADDMGLDLRLGHLLPMGGKPYITHEGLKFLLQAEHGPGIKDCSFTWVESDWAEQLFVAKCTITTDADRRYEGEGDAVGVPLADLKEMWKEAAGIKGIKEFEVRKHVMGMVKAYPLKNVATPIAMDLASRRMAQTRAFNRAARIALTLALPTVEERLIEAPAGVEFFEGDDVVHLATSDQVKKIKEFAKSKKEGMNELVLQYSQDHGKPEIWPIDVASAFIDTAIVLVGEAKKEKKEGKTVKLDV